MEDTFKIHRNKAKVVFVNDSLTADKLSISGTVPRTYIKWIEAVKKLYSIVSKDTVIQSMLARLIISADGLIAANTQITDLETARAEYLKEKGNHKIQRKQKMQQVQR